MSDLTHQHLVRRMNHRAKIQHENARMEIMESHTSRLMVSILAAALIVIIALLVDDHLIEHDTQSAAGTPSRVEI